MAWSDQATHPVTGETVPRCQATPGPAEIAARPALGAHVWACGLPAGHQGWPPVDGDRDLTPFLAHSWSNTED
jgi:hypothetical protein